MCIPSNVNVNLQFYAAHKRKSSNALYALARSEHKRFQMLSEFVSANIRITQVVWQSIPHRRINHRESLSGGGV